MEQDAQKPGFRILGSAWSGDGRRYVLVAFDYSKYPYVFSIVIDNHRVLHGRSAFNGKRRMCGAYVGMDEFRSKLMVLNERFASGGTGGSEGRRPNFGPHF